MRGYPKKDEKLAENPNGYHIFGQNIKYQHPQKVLLDEKYLHRLKNPILAYTSSVGEIGMIEEDFYRSGDNGAFQGLFPRFQKYNKLHILFILAILQKQFICFGYATSMKNILDIKILLPTQNSQIAFDFIESFIKAIEKQTIEAVNLFSQTRLDAYKNIIKDF